jgi:hypothetical protein
VVLTLDKGEVSSFTLYGRRLSDGCIEYAPDEVPDQPGREWGVYM